MTKYKEYLRANGCPLENDFMFLPTEDGLQAITTHVFDFGIIVTKYYSSIISRKIYTPSGKVIDVMEDVNVLQDSVQFSLYNDIPFYIFGFNKDFELTTAVYSKEDYLRLL